MNKTQTIYNPFLIFFGIILVIISVVLMIIAGIGMYNWVNGNPPPKSSIITPTIVAMLTGYFSALVFEASQRIINHEKEDK